MPAPGPLILLRHGQSILNAQGPVTGLLNPPPTWAGRVEAAAAGAQVRVASLYSRAVYIPALSRARGTALTILASIRSCRMGRLVPTSMTTKEPHERSFYE